MSGDVSTIRPYNFKILNVVQAIFGSCRLTLEVITSGIDVPVPADNSATWQNKPVNINTLFAEEDISYDPAAQMQSNLDGPVTSKYSKHDDTNDTTKMFAAAVVPQCNPVHENQNWASLFSRKLSNVGRYVTKNYKSEMVLFPLMM